MGTAIKDKCLLICDTDVSLDFVFGFGVVGMEGETGTDGSGDVVRCGL